MSKISGTIRMPPWACPLRGQANTAEGFAQLKTRNTAGTLDVQHKVYRAEG